MASAEEGDCQDLRIVLLGVSGAGKSSIGNAILGRKAFKESRTIESEKQNARVEDRNISIIDTPGFFSVYLTSNEHLTDEELKKQMIKSFFLSVPGPHVFLLVINLENFELDQRNIMENVQESFGVQALRFTMVLFTGREQITKRKWKHIMESSEFQKLVLQCRGHYHVINNKNEIFRNEITKILERIDEIVNQNNGHHYGTVAAEQHLIPSVLSDMRIMMVGKTGAGKSSTGNTILGQKVFEEKISTECVTKECQKHQKIVEGKIITVIDTPGLFDTKGNKGDFKYCVRKWVEMSVPGPHAILLVIRLDMRFTKEEKNTVKWIQENFTADASRYTIVLFTRGDQLERPIEEFLTKNKQIKELVRQCEGGYHVFNNKDEENRSQVTELLEKIDRMVKENGGEHYTNEMYKEAQKNVEEKEKKKREEEEENRKTEEKFRNMSTGKKKALKGLAILGSAVGGAALAVGGVAATAVSLAAAPLVLISGGGALTAVQSVSMIEETIADKEEQKEEEEEQ